MKSHLKIHKESNAKLNCNLCVFQTQYSSTLKAHINSVHLKGKLDKIPKCSICGKALSSKQSLKNYTQLHSNEEFQCKVCNYKKKVSIHLKNHFRSNHRGKKFKCESTYQTAISTRYQNHIKIHSI